MPTSQVYGSRSGAASQELPEIAVLLRCATGPAQRSEHGPGAKRTGCAWMPESGALDPRPVITGVTRVILGGLAAEKRGFYGPF